MCHNETRPREKMEDIKYEVPDRLLTSSLNLHEIDIRGRSLAAGRTFSDSLKTRARARPRSTATKGLIRNIIFECLAAYLLQHRTTYSNVQGLGIYDVQGSEPVLF